MASPLPSLSLAIALLLASTIVAAEPLRVLGPSGDPPRKEKRHVADATFDDLLAEADALYDAGDNAKAADAYAAVTASPAFAAVRVPRQYTVWERAAIVAWRLQRFDEGLVFAQRAQALKPDEAFDVGRVVTFLNRLGRPADAADAVIAFAKRRPEALADLDAAVLYRLAIELKDRPRVQADYLQALFDAQWDDPTADSSSLWYYLALARVRLGEPERARAAIGRVVAPEAVIRLRDDKRFDALVDRDASAFDVKAAALRTVAALREKAARQPRSLDVRHALASALLQADALQDVLDLSEAAQQAIAAGGDAPPYDDPDVLTWMLDTRAIALRRLGRIDEAVALMERIRDDPEDGQPNVSQAINLGMLHCQVGRPRDALAGIARIEDGGMSDYGRTQSASVRLCAAVALGDRELQRTAFDFIRAHRAASQATYLDALLMLGRVDDAARIYIEWLASEDERADALFELQDQRRPPPLPGDRAVEASWRALLARDDVRAAVDRVGRIEHHEVNTQYRF